MIGIIAQCIIRHYRAGFYIVIRGKCFLWNYGSLLQDSVFLFKCAVSLDNVGQCIRCKCFIWCCGTVFYVVL